MRLSLSGRDVACVARLLMLIAGSMAALAPMLHVQSAAAQDVRAAIGKANLYIEVAKLTERAVDSWDRYASWVSMKTGPTGKERYISYGMYELYDVAGLLKEARKAANLKPSTPNLDTTMKRYMDAYEVLAPVMNRASDYYERKGYRTDGMAEGRALHARMVPLASAFLIEREAMLRQLRAFVRGVEQQEVAAIEAREGRSRKWQVAQVMHAANRVVDLFPRARPTPIDSDTIEEMLKAIGPDTPGEKLDEIIGGVVRPAGVVIDMKQFQAAVKRYADAVEMLDRFAAEKPEGLKDLKDQARRLLDGLRALQQPWSAVRAATSMAPDHW
ncbi:MAG: DUF3829 domain-containing protein [Hyphomicrobiaceae bacterium]